MGLEHLCLKFQLNFIVCLTNNIIDGILGFIFCLGFPGNEGYGLHPGKNIWDLLITFYKNVASIVEENDSPANAGETKFYDTL